MARKNPTTKVKGCRKCGRSKRGIRYPLMPDKLTRAQALRWYRTRYNSR